MERRGSGGGRAKNGGEKNSEESTRPQNNEIQIREPFIFCGLSPFFFLSFSFRVQRILTITAYFSDCFSLSLRISNGF